LQWPIPSPNKFATGRHKPESDITSCRYVSNHMDAFLWREEEEKEAEKIGIWREEEQLKKEERYKIRERRQG
jgi:hypothetical protein